MSHREMKSNIYGTSTHFSCFLQNWSNCKTVLQLRPFNKLAFSIFQMILWPFGITEEDQVCLLKFGGSNLSQLLKIHFKGVILELLAPICKIEKSGIHSCNFFPTGSVPSCSRWGCTLTLHQSFPSLVRLSLSLTDASTVLVPPSSTAEVGWRRARGRPDGIPDWFPVPYRQDLCLICPFL